MGDATNEQTGDTNNGADTKDIAQEDRNTSHAVSKSPHSEGEANVQPSLVFLVPSEGVINDNVDEHDDLFSIDDY